MSRWGILLESCFVEQGVEFAFKSWIGSFDFAVAGEVVEDKLALGRGWISPPRRAKILDAQIEFSFAFIKEGAYHRDSKSSNSSYL